jgi:hypothetical protein
MMASVNHDAESVELSPTLLNAKDKIKLMVLLNGRSPKPEVTARIVGVSHIKWGRRAYTSKSAFVGTLLITFLPLLFFGTLLYISPGNEYLKHQLTTAYFLLGTPLGAYAALAFANYFDLEFLNQKILKVELLIIATILTLNTIIYVLIVGLTAISGLNK